MFAYGPDGVIRYRSLLGCLERLKQTAEKGTEIRLPRALEVRRLVKKGYKWPRRS